METRKYQHRFAFNIGIFIFLEIIVVVVVVFLDFISILTIVNPLLGDCVETSPNVVWLPSYPDGNSWALTRLVWAGH